MGWHFNLHRQKQIEDNEEIEWFWGWYNTHRHYRLLSIAYIITFPTKHRLKNLQTKILKWNVFSEIKTQEDQNRLVWWEDWSPFGKNETSMGTKKDKIIIKTWYILPSWCKNTWLILRCILHGSMGQYCR